MNSPFMDDIATGLAAKGINVARFEFTYMAQRGDGAAKRPPPRAEKLNGEFLSAVAALDVKGPLFIGGKSMGGRIASMIGDDLYAKGEIAGVICLGYPFHPVGKPELLRTAHLETLAVPTLICQGTRDPFGVVAEVDSYTLSPSILLKWISDGDHSFKPRKSYRYTLQNNLADAVDAMVAFIGAHSV